MKLQKTIEIIIEGNTDDDCDDAFDEAVRVIKTGCVCGWDKSEDSQYSFEIKESKNEKT